MLFWIIGIFTWILGMKKLGIEWKRGWIRSRFEASILKGRERKDIRLLSKSLRIWMHHSYEELSLENRFLKKPKANIHFIESFWSWILFDRTVYRSSLSWKQFILMANFFSWNIPYSWKPCTSLPYDTLVPIPLQTALPCLWVADKLAAIYVRTMAWRMRSIHSLFVYIILL